MISMLRPLTATLPSVLSLVLLCGCTTSDQIASEVRDSAGISIVHNAITDKTPTLGWTADSVPAVRIGGARSEGQHQFGVILSATRLSDGRIAVLDGRNSEVRLFGPDGKFLSSFGRAGQGPGEFEELWRMVRTPGDSLLVFDQHGSNAQLFTSSGSFVRTEPKLQSRKADGRPRPAPQRVAAFSDGEYLLSTNLLSCINIKQLGGGMIEIDDKPRPACDDSLEFARATHDGVENATYGSFVYSRQRSASLARGPMPVTMPREFFWAVHRDKLIVGDAGAGDIRFMDRDAKTVVISRFIGERTALDPSRTLVTITDSGTTPEQRRLNEEFREAMRKVDFPKYVPVFSGMVVDRTGDIWVRPNVQVNAEAARRALRTWWILDSAGVIKGTVILPDGFLAPDKYDMVNVEFGEDYILAVARDQNDVQEVQLFRLRR